MAWKYREYQSGVVFQFIEIPPVGSDKGICIGPMLIGQKKEADILRAALNGEPTAGQGESAPKAPNSRYVTALAVVSEWMEQSKIGVSKDFTVWVSERLNAEKDPHCT